ncbi:MAG: DUF3488 domain-containing transglutaminase family protein [Pseudomonadales bacterium]|nr:DUF3488 domain-containing transglutaminase family protein [Pseudomonadales bacterium]
MTEQTPRLTLWWLLAAFALVVSPHLLRLPLGVSVLIGACILWRVFIFQGRISFPGTTLRMLIVFLSLPLTVLSYRGQGAGLDAAICLLILGTSFKLLEMRQARDMTIVLCLCYVLTMVGFIYSQTIPAALLALATVVVITGALITLQRNNGHSSLRSNGGLALRMVAQSIPLTIALFVLVPRVAPLWSMPIPVPSSKTGVTDEMSPGDISRLSRSAELAFRVSFDADTPSNEKLYWRGLVLDFFDGRVWRRAGSSFQSFDMIERFRSPFRGETLGEEVSYDVILEPTQQSWIYALQLAQFNASDIVQDRYYTLHTEKPVSQRYRYQVRSALDYHTDVSLSGVLRARAMQLPEDDNNVRARELASELRRGNPDDRDYALQVLRYFREQPFYYTLTPPPLGEASIDDFLFNSLQGFCEHYAGSFVYLMRAAGIPARVVVGYQGGEVNPFEGYTMVYQYNAHAWAEVWLENEGWVRFDPTAAVAPERISMGVQAVLANQPGFLEDSRFSMMRFRNTQWLNALRLRLDAMDYAWNRWVVSYDEDMQLDLLDSLLGPQMRGRLFLVLGVVIALFFLVAAIFLLRRREQESRDMATRLYLRLAADLADAGMKRGRGEGPQDFCQRLARQEPRYASDMGRITEIYVQVSYGPQTQTERHEQLLQELQLRIRDLRLRVLSPLRRLRLRMLPIRY